MMTIVRVHVSHLTNIPYFQASVIRDRIELIILSVKLNGCDGVSMSNKCLYLFLVVNVPDSDNSVLAATDQVLSISG